MSAGFTAGIRIFMRDGKLWRREGLGNEATPTVRLTRDHLQVGCTTITREAFKYLMAEATEFWGEAEKIVQ